jgi:hypothetical protein
MDDSAALVVQFAGKDRPVEGGDSVTNAFVCDRRRAQCRNLLPYAYLSSIMADLLGKRRAWGLTQARRQVGII